MDDTLLPGGVNAAVAPAGASLEMRSVSHSVNIRRRIGKYTKKIVLDSVSCSFEACSFAAVLGPSGAGKSTLLSVLRTGRSKSGDVLLDNAPYAHSRGCVVTVPQDDVLLSGLSALEMLSYSAELRMRHATAEERHARVRSVLKSLHLADDEILQRIGSVDSRGLSGGQRKRVSIGLELISRPRALLLDEPTSGLDAKMAYDTVQLLRSLARNDGQTVIATIHQPSWRCFNTFDTAVVLAKGGVAYGGRVDGIRPHLDALSVTCDVHENPADTLLFLLQAGDDDGGSTRAIDFVAAWRQRAAENRQTYQQPITAAAAAEQNGGAATAGNGVAPSRAQRRGSRGGAKAALAVSEQVGVLRQTWVLLRRRLWDTTQDPAKFGRQLLLKTMVGVLVGVIWLGEGNSPKYDSIFPTTGALFLVVNNSCLDILLDTVLHFPPARALLRREYNNGLFCVLAFWGSLLLSNMLLCTLNAMLLALPVYGLVGFMLTWQRLGIFIGCLSLMSIVGGAIGVIIGCLCKDLGAARTAILPTLVPLLIFSGYVIPYEKIAWYFRPCYYASFFQYSFAILQINELSGRVFTEDCPAELVEAVLEQRLEETIADRFPALSHYLNATHAYPLLNATFNCTGDEYLARASLYPTPYGGMHGYFQILGGYAVGAQALAYLVLRWKVAMMGYEHA